MQKPTIGRIVHYHTRLSWVDEKDICHNDNTILPAIITRVHSATCVNLRVFHEGSERSSWFFEKVIQGNESGSGNWDWPVIEK